MQHQMTAARRNETRCCAADARCGAGDKGYGT
jgi:hypothetical protein